MNNDKNNSIFDFKVVDTKNNIPNKHVYCKFYRTNFYQVAKPYKALIRMI